MRRECLTPTQVWAHVLQFNLFIGQAIGDVGGAALCRGLADKPQLEMLSLNSCGLGSAAARALALAMPSMIQLQDLRLQQNKLDPDAAEARDASNFAVIHPPSEDMDLGDLELSNLVGRYIWPPPHHPYLHQR